MQTQRMLKLAPRRRPQALLAGLLCMLLGQAGCTLGPKWAGPAPGFPPAWAVVDASELLSPAASAALAQQLRSLKAARLSGVVMLHVAPEQIADAAAMAAEHGLQCGIHTSVSILEPAARPLLDRALRDARIHAWVVPAGQTPAQARGAVRLAERFSEQDPARPVLLLDVPIAPPRPPPQAARPGTRATPASASISIERSAVWLTTVATATPAPAPVPAAALLPEVDPSSSASSEAAVQQDAAEADRRPRVLEVVHPATQEAPPASNPNEPESPDPADALLEGAVHAPPDAAADAAEPPDIDDSPSLPPATTALPADPDSLPVPHPAAAVVQKAAAYASLVELYDIDSPPGMLWLQYHTGLLRSPMGLVLGPRASELLTERRSWSRPAEHRLLLRQMVERQAAWGPLLAGASVHRTGLWADGQVQVAEFLRDQRRFWLVINLRPDRFHTGPIRWPALRSAERLRLVDLTSASMHTVTQASPTVSLSLPPGQAALFEALP